MFPQAAPSLCSSPRADLNPERDVNNFPSIYFTPPSVAVRVLSCSLLFFAAWRAWRGDLIRTSLLNPHSPAPKTTAYLSDRNSHLSSEKPESKASNTHTKKKKIRPRVSKEASLGWERRGLADKRIAGQREQTQLFSCGGKQLQSKLLSFSSTTWTLIPANAHFAQSAFSSLFFFFLVFCVTLQANNSPHLLTSSTILLIGWEEFSSAAFFQMKLLVQNS